MTAQSNPKRMPGRGKRALFAGVGSALVLALLELIGVFFYFIVLSKPSRQMIELTLGMQKPFQYGTMSLHYKPHPYFNYTFNPDFTYPDGRKPYNAHGFRMPEWPGRKSRGTLRIVALGASTTYGMFATSGETVWPAMVERALQKRFSLPIEVYNLGVPGYTTHEILGVLCMLVPELEPDMVLIHCGANDAFAQAYPDEGGPDNTRFRFSWNYRPLPAPVRLAMRASYLLRTIGVLFFSRGSYLPGDVLKLVQYPPPAGDQALKNSHNAKGKYFRRNLKTMVAVARDLGAVPILINHPLNPKWDNMQEPYYRAIVESHLRCNRIGQELAQEIQVPIIDLFPWMRDAQLFVDAIHVNDGGMKLKARIIEKYLAAFVREKWQGGVSPAAR